MTEKLSITITDEQARRIRHKVETGEFASASEVIRSALARAERSEEAEYETRIAEIRTKVEAALNDRRPRLTPDEVHQSLLRHHEEALMRHAKR